MGDSGDFYSELGVERNCSQDELKQAFKKLALLYHPDRQATGNEAKFRMIERAYKILSDVSSRAAYDAQLDNAARLDYPVWQVVTPSELDFIEEEDSYMMDCRCGAALKLDKHSVTSNQLPVIIQCEDCSTYVRVDEDN